MKTPPEHVRGFDKWSPSDVRILRSILNSQGFAVAPGLPTFDTKLEAVLAAFQACHRDEKGRPLQVDGDPGKNTAWALYHPDGEDQSKGSPNPVSVPAKKSISYSDKSREDFVRVLQTEADAGSRETPSGANWGGGVTKYLKHAGGPRFWCMHFICWCWKQASQSYPFGVDFGSVAAFLKSAQERGLAFQRDKYKPRSGDIGIVLYVNSGGELTGLGHIFGVVDGPPTGPLLCVGGNEGNAVRWSERSRTSPSTFFWVNLHGDHAEPYRHHKFVTRKAEAADDSHAKTR